VTADQKKHYREPGFASISARVRLSGLWLGLLLLLSLPVEASRAGLGFHRAEIENHAPSETPLAHQLFLPSIPQEVINPLPTIFGVEMFHLTDTSGAQQMFAAGTSWMRFSWSGVQWSQVEAQQGIYDWSALSQLDNDLKIAAQHQVQALVVVRGTPDWAQQVPGAACGPILADKLGAFADFMYALVSRYRQAPYNIRYWEIWNEPDVAPDQVAPDSVWGCWGDPAAEYYGGRYFGEMLSTIYPRIKEADPQAQVILGGLILDCDPDNPPTGKDCSSSKFFEGVLRNGNGANFDGVAFHAYDYYMGSLGSYFNPNWHSAWNTSGSVSNAKEEYLRNLLVKFDISGKFLMNTENALLCDICAGNETFETTKAYYLTQVYGSAIANGLEANIWHKVFDWRGSGLLNTDLSPRPAYTAFQFARRELASALYRRQIVEYPGVKGFEFQRGSQFIWLVWSLDGDTHTISLPDAPLAVYDALGNPKALSDKLSIDLTPYFIEFPAR
jgi:hypothetical protein